ncbi:hypothetical protein J5A61_09385 [Arachnia propionica]|uniref:hypothetical protein n=1 Tax=Arachnia propionica TaxID=1750 RepID=UPI001BA8C9DE|nr:hypothetical protein [Arachnia propionica]QUC13090.1 hypothetical protein J5A61_09385 [Arachnia propionica]
MTIIVYPVGQGDLRNDIVGLSKSERQEAQGEAEQQVEKFLDDEDSEGLLKVLLEAPEEGSRFSAPPLSLILRALFPAEGERVVTVLLLASRSGDSGTRTWKIGELLKKALGLAGVHDGLRKELRLDVSVEMCEANLQETAGVEELAERLRCLVDSQNQTGDEPKVVVNAISGASMIALGAMGAADQLGLDWRAAVAPGAQKDTAVLLDRSSYDTAPFYWLRSLGYVEQARNWAQGRLARSSGRASVDVGSLDGLTDLMKRLATNPESLKDEDLASLLALDMARADNGAGLIARAWAQKHYLTLHDEEVRDQQDAPENLVTEAIQTRTHGRPPQLGDVLATAQRRVDESGEQCPSSVRWLLGHRWLNEVGKTAVHDLAAPSASDVNRTLSLDELSSALPDWVARPGRGAVLFIVSCGAGAPRGMCVTERILGKEPDKKIRRAVPGAMLDGAESLPAEFLLLHSSYPGSKKTSLDAADAARRTQVHAGWKRHVSPSVDKRDFVDQRDYEGGDRNEYVATPVIMRSVSGQVALALEAKHPAAVIIVGTGQKAAVLGALQAAQAWCAEHATPLFLQTFVDKVDEEGRKESVSQLHRFALHNDAETALREAAISSLKSLNLLSAVRVLAAGDWRMDEMADRCDKLRQQLLDVANDKENPDRGAGVLIDLLQTVAGLWTEATELTKMRLAVVVAEALNFKTKGSNLLHRNNNLEGGSGNPINLARPYPKDCDKKRSKDKGPHQDLLEILYRVRNKLVVTHADDIVKSALQMVLQDLGGANIRTDSKAVSGDDVTYPDVLRLTCEKLEEAARALSITWASSTWKAEFDHLMSELKSLAHTREP